MGFGQRAGRRFKQDVALVIYAGGVEYALEREPDCGRSVHTELCGNLVGAEPAAVAEELGKTYDPIGPADLSDEKPGERLPGA